MRYELKGGRIFDKKAKRDVNMNKDIYLKLLELLLNEKANEAIALAHENQLLEESTQHMKLFILKIHPAMEKVLIPILNQTLNEQFRIASSYNNYKHLLNFKAEGDKPEPITFKLGSIVIEGKIDTNSF